jgi:hypothetical protein
MSSFYQAYTKRPAGVTEYDCITVPNKGGGVSVSEPLENWLLIDYYRSLYLNTKFTLKRSSAVSRSMILVIEPLSSAEQPYVYVCITTAF